MNELENMLKDLYLISGLNMSIFDFELIESIKDALVDFIIKSDSKIY